MEERWRTLLEARGGVPPEAEPMAGDVGMLVPLAAHWKVVDLTLGFGARGAVLAPWCQQVTVVAHDPDALAVMEARGSSLGSFAERWRPQLCTGSLGLPAAGADLILLEGDGPWSPEEVLAFLRPGGYLVWLLEGAPFAGLRPSGLADVPRAARAAFRVASQRLLSPWLWQDRLKAIGFRDMALYLQVREYFWGFVPFQARPLHRYYLEAMQEEGVGASKGKARLARLTARVGLYPYLVSGYALVARAAGEVSP